MNRIINILFLLFSMTVVYGQHNKYCLYDDAAIKAYQEKQFDEARLLMDSALQNCEEVTNDPYAYHVKGFICKDIFKTKEKDDVNSPARECAINAFKKSVQLDTAGVYQKNNFAALKALANSYYNDAASLFDTNNYQRALILYNKFKELTSFFNPNYDFTSKDVVVNNVMGLIYKEKYLNNKEKYAVYLDSSIASYSKTIELDSMNYSAYYNLGVIYYNKGVDLILSLDDESDLLYVIEAQEKQLEYCQKALPYLKKAYAIRPSKEIVEGFRGIYLSLNDDEKYQFYTNELKKFEGND